MAVTLGGGARGTNAPLIFIFFLPKNISFWLMSGRGTYNKNLRWESEEFVLCIFGVVQTNLPPLSDFDDFVNFLMPVVDFASTSQVLLAKLRLCIYCYLSNQ
jgi:hypothetical protein